MGKKRQLDDGGGEYIAPKGLGSGDKQGAPRRAIATGLDIDEVPRPKKTKPQNLQKLSMDDLNQRKHDLKMEENYHSNVMGIKKRGPYSASDVRASYTQVLRFQYLQKEVDLEIERREARTESQKEAKARKKQEKEETQRAVKAALAAAQDDSFFGPGVALPPGAPAGGDVASGGGFTSWDDMSMRSPTSLSSGLLCYLWGSRTGRLCFQRVWPSILRFAEAWQKFARPMVLLAIFLPMVAGPFISLALGPGSLPPLPLDMAEPELRPGALLPRLQYNGWIILECPPFIIGLLIGIVMSVCGAAVATFFCGHFDSHERPAARLLVNLVASLLAYSARGLDAALDSMEGSSPSGDFLRSKFVSSFCGALSAFSGTIGDIADVQFGCATEDSMLDVPEKHGRGKAPQLRGLSRIPAIHNFLLHWLLTLLVMWGCARFETWPPMSHLELTQPVQPVALEPRSVVRRDKARHGKAKDRGALEPDADAEV